MNDDGSVDMVTVEVDTEGRTITETTSEIDDYGTLDVRETRTTTVDPDLSRRPGFLGLLAGPEESVRPYLQKKT